MKRTIPTPLSFLKASGRRRKPLSALIGVLLFIGGFPFVGMANTPCSTPGSCSFTISVIQNNQIANGSASDIIEITVIDLTTNQPAVGVSLNMQVGSNPLSSAGTTNSSGIVDFNVNTTVAGTYPVNFTVSGTDPVTGDFSYPISSTSVNFIAGVPSPSNPQTQLIIDVQSTAADGTSIDQVHVHLVDSKGNVVQNQMVSITFGFAVAGPIDGTAGLTVTNTGGGSGGGPYTVMTDGSGNVYLTITNTQTGIVNLGVTVNGLTITNGSPAAVQFTNPPPDPAKSYIVAAVTPMPADGSSQDVVKAVVNNVLGNPVPDGTPVTFTIETGTATITTTGLTVGGIATAYFTSTVVGSVQVQATITVGGTVTNLYDQANPANNYVTVQFVIPPPDPAKSYIVATVTPMPADGTSQDAVQAVVNNALGVAVPDGTVVTFTIETGTATITTTGVTTGGIATAYFTSTVVGSVQVQATVSGTYLTDQNNPANNYVTVQFVVPPPDATKSYIVATVTPMPADGSSQDVVQAVVNNSLGVAVPDGTVVTFTIETGTATITTTGVTTGGIATAYFTSTVVGSVQVQATVTISGTVTNLYDQNNPTNNFVTIQFITGQPVPGNPGGGGTGGTPPGNGGTDPGSGGNNTGPGSNYTLLFVRQDYQLADGTHQDSIIAYITDGSKHPVKNVPVTFFIQTSPTSGSITAGAQFVGSTAVSTDDSGMARIAITSTKSGTVFVDATIVDPVSGNTVLIDGSYQIATFVDAPDFNNPLTTLSVVVYEALADGSQQTVVKAHLVDLDGLVMPGQEVTFSIDSGSGKIITPQPVVTDANGDAYIYITSTTPGDVLITATVDGGQIKNGSPARVKFVAPNIYVPRVFTPNNDGTNDVLKPILVGISTFHYFSIYNRWGNLIYTSQDPNQGWDGTFKGVAQPVETYLWIAEGVNTEGKTITQKGMVSLVR